MDTIQNRPKLMVKYSMNNSGGRDWLTEENWEALEKAEWRLVRWNDEYDYLNGQYRYDDQGVPMFTGKKKEDSVWGDRYHYAFKGFDTIKESLLEFGEVTGQDAMEEGCTCCGPPHEFSWWEIDKQTSGERMVGGEYASGEELAEHLYDPALASKSKRDLLELLANK